MELTFYREQQIPTKKIKTGQQGFLGRAFEFPAAKGSESPMDSWAAAFHGFFFLFFFWMYIKFSITTRVCSWVLQLGYPEGIDVSLLASSLSWATVIWRTVVLVWEKTCSQFTFLVLTTLPSCSSNLLLKGSVSLLLSQNLFYTSCPSYCPSPALLYPKIFQSCVQGLHIVFSFILYFPRSHS